MTWNELLLSHTYIVFIPPPRPFQMSGVSQLGVGTVLQLERGTCARKFDQSKAQSTNEHIPPPSPVPGDESSWRMASIQPVPIPDLSHTGIRTKFSPGAGNGFTPNGAMTSTFRTSIHDAMRSLPGGGLGDPHDMKTRDYARAIRNHKVDPCGGPLLHAHMSSLELGLAPGGGSGSVAGAAGSLMAPRLLQEGASGRRSASLGVLRGRLSPPSSPSNRRALASDGAGIDLNVGGVGLSGGASGGGGGGGSGVGVGVGGTPSDSRHALLQRELRSVRLASAAVASVGLDCDSGDVRVGGTKGGIVPPRREITAVVGSQIAGGWRTKSGIHPTRRVKTQVQGVSIACGGEEESQVWKEGGENQELDTSRRRDVSDARCGTVSNAGKQRTRSRVDVDRQVASCLRKTEEPEDEAGDDNGRSSGEVEALFDGDEAWQKERERGRRRKGRRGRRRVVPPAAGIFEGGEQGRVQSGGRKLEVPVSSSSLPLRGWNLGAENYVRRRSADKRSTRSARLRKPFSSDSLFACLLDVHYGNTRDLSPDKTARKWDLQVLPPRTATSGVAPRAWDGFASDDTDGDDMTERLDALSREGGVPSMSGSSGDLTEVRAGKRHM